MIKIIANGQMIKIIDYNCKVNKYVSPEDAMYHADGDRSSRRITVKHDGKTYPFSVPVSTPITPNGFSMEIHALSSESEADEDEEPEAEISTTNLHLTTAGDRGENQATLKADASKSASLAVRMDRICESHNAVMLRLKAMDDEIKNMQHTMSRGENVVVIGDEKQTELDERKLEEECMENRTHISVSTPIKTMTNSLCKDGTLTPMDTSITLTPIGSEMEHNVHCGNLARHHQIHSAKKLGIIVVPDITSSSVGGQFTVVDSSMSISTTRQ